MLLSTHGGNIRQFAEAAGRSPDEILDFSANINPFGPPEWLRSLVSSKLSQTAHYPDPESKALIDALSRCYGVRGEQIAVGCGSTELLYAIPRALGKLRSVIPVPSYTDYERASRLAGLKVDLMEMKECSGFKLDLSELEDRLLGDELVFLGQPNNPTGLTFDVKGFRALAEKKTSAIFVVDEAFMDFVEGADRWTNELPRNVIRVCSFTKFYAIPGIRLGCLIAEAETAGKIKEFLLPWSVNTLAQAVGEAASLDESYLKSTRFYVREGRDFLYGELKKITGLSVYPSQANFLLVRIALAGMNATELSKKLLDEGIAIRVCQDFRGLDERYFRVAVRTERENRKLLHAICKVIGVRKHVRRKKKTPAIMFQGTSSDAGKSILAAGLCRVLFQDGYRVAPFKAQNMSLNSFVTNDGCEIGRSQALQAQACRLEPDARMNPILLKPSADTIAQVIVNGKPIGNKEVDQYIEYKREAFRIVRDAYDSLSEENEVIVLEGAGSPGEVNLKHHDIVNMKMAHHASAPVILIGDIDRGGVFASFIGTMEVLSEWERKMVAGFIINKFRGKRELLGNALEYTSRHTGKPFFGIVPFLHDLRLPEEDSVLSFKKKLLEKGESLDGSVQVAVIALPHISNFTDFDSFRIEPDVDLRVVRTVDDLADPDALIIPGSKNVAGDILFLRRSGLSDKILGLVDSRETETVGICGGFQILGKEIKDPHGLESRKKNTKALSVLPLSTVLAKDKTLRRVRAKHVDSNLEVIGYEIHHGQTEGDSAFPAVVREDGSVIGEKLENGMVWGTYLHGIFDKDEFRRWFINRLRKRKGLGVPKKVCLRYTVEPELDRLAEVVRRNLDMKKIYELLSTTILPNS